MELMRRLTRVAALAAATLVFAFPNVACASAPTVSIQTAEPGKYQLEGHFTVDATTATAWDVITDYDGIDRFVSSMESSRVLHREPERAVVEQVGRGRFLFFHKRVRLTLEIKETPGHVEFKKRYGPDFIEYQGSWDLRPSEDGCDVVYRLDAEPGPSLGPRFAAKRTLVKTAEELLDQVRKEILRRTRPDL